MKRICFFLVAAVLTAPAVVRAQDAAVEERLNKLSAQIEDLVVAKDAQNKRIEELARALRELQDQQNRPNGSYASQEDVKRLAGKLDEIDRKRQDDNEKIFRGIQKEIDKLTKVPANSSTKTAPTPGPKSNSTPSPSGNTGASASTSSEPFEYEIKENDTLRAIAKAYTDQGKKVTYEQILKANPGLVPEKLKIGQKIIIPTTSQ